MVCTYVLSFRSLPFHFVDDFFCYAEVFNLMFSHLLIFAFIACAFGVISKKIIAQTNVKEIFLFSCRNFMVSGILVCL